LTRRQYFDKNQKIIVECGRFPYVTNLNGNDNLFSFGEVYNETVTRTSNDLYLFKCSLIYPKIFVSVMPLKKSNNGISYSGKYPDYFNKFPPISPVPLIGIEA